MEDQAYFDLTFRALHERQLGKALHTMREFIASHPLVTHDYSLQGIDEDYQRLLDYMLDGYQDSQRDEIYQSLLKRMYRFTANTRMGWLCLSKPFFHDTQMRGTRQMISKERIESAMRNFVTDTAMLSLEPEDTRSQNEKGIYGRHHDFMSAFFDRLVVGSQWEKADREFYQELLLSPTVDTLDVQLAESAITLSCLAQFDVEKFLLLSHIFEHSSDSAIRQRAFVGWAFALMLLDLSVYSELKEHASQLCKAHAQELLELQRQINFCINAERDHETIQRDIMPTLIKNNGFSITRNGIIEEREDDPMEDILNPNAADQRMEEMEKTMQRMIDMQKQGSDIYFGGFRQMKRFAFFYTLSNWFTPFYMQHPEISKVVEKLKGSNFLEILLQGSVFCNSDKYSFTLAMSSVIDRLPANLREMLGNAETIGPEGLSGETGKPHYIRMFYLQDLYRFFRLYLQKESIEYNPFASGNNFLFSHEIFEQSGELKIMLARARFHIQSHRHDIAIKELHAVTKQYPDSVQALALLARSFMSSQLYGSALECYEKLLLMNPKNFSYQLNHALALTQMNQYEQAIEELYKLSYENPDDANVTRTLAWALMGNGRDEQAGKEYEKLLSSEDCNHADLLNAAYCQWFLGHLKEAVRLMRQFQEASKKADLLSEFMNDKEMLERHGISKLEQSLMIDMAGRTL